MGTTPGGDTSRSSKKRLTWARVRGVLGTGEVWLLRRVISAAASGARSLAVLRLYLVDSGMNAAMDQICAGYEDKDLQLLTGFLRRTADAARTAAERLTAS